MSFVILQVKVFVSLDSPFVDDIYISHFIMSNWDICFILFLIYFCISSF